jgi:hypothetical protein
VSAILYKRKLWLIAAYVLSINPEGKAHHGEVAFVWLRYSPKSRPEIGQFKVIAAASFALAGRPFPASGILLISIPTFNSLLVKSRLVN